MRDAVAELEEWDPEEEVGDDPFGLDAYDEENEKPDPPNADSSDEPNNRAILQSGVKSEALKVLTRIPQSIHVVLKQRLSASHLPEPSTMSPPQRATLDTLISHTQQISSTIDESAEALYMGDLERCLKLSGEARSLAIEVVESVREGWVPGGGVSKEDVYVARALEWVKRVKRVQPLPGEGVGEGKGREKTMDGPRVSGITEGVKSVTIS
jgi:hypothetical protein